MNRATLMIGDTTYVCRWHYNGSGIVSIIHANEPIREVPMDRFRFNDRHNRECHVQWNEDADICILERVTNEQSNAATVRQES